MGYINYLVLSDIHLGHNKNDTADIITNLKEYFKDNHKVFKTLDIIFIAGDIFDKLLVNGSKNHLLIMSWLTLLAMYCKTNNIKLRILEGTKSHDWAQASVLNAMLDKANIGVDFKYVDTLAIEEMTDLDLSILYIPDEYKHKASDTYIDVKKLLEEHKLHQVDIAIMHGQFHYQLPMITLESSHEEQDYLDIVKYYISIGHIHKHSYNGRILAQGSFDRLAHGEEEPKGAMLISINKVTDVTEFRFIENKRARIFKTVDCSEYPDTELMGQLKKRLATIPLGSHIRVLTATDSLFNKNKQEIKNEHPAYHFLIETEKDKRSKDKNIDLVNTPIIDSFHITKDNIAILLTEELTKTGLTAREHDIFKEELAMVMDTI